MVVDGVAAPIRRHPPLGVLSSPSKKSPQMVWACAAGSAAAKKSLPAMSPFAMSG